jgi:pimeloyl-ACP methyl ester carboxylesterase
LSVVSDSNGVGARLLGRASDSIGTFQFRDNGDTATQGYVQGRSTDLRIGSGTGLPLLFIANDSERARIDSSGRLLVGTSSARSNFNAGYDSAALQIEGTGTASSTLSCVRNSNDGAGAIIAIGHSRGSTVNANTILQSGDNVGGIIFEGADGANFVRGAKIDCAVDGTPAANSMPGRLVFSTTAAGASSPTERMRITSDGYVYIGKTTGSTSVAGTVFLQNYAVITSTATNAGDRCLILNRQSADGDLLQFWQADTQEGAVSVSGTTVTYGGGHLARWSQLPNDEDPSGILKGTVMSNLDEMCEWGEEDNEQLNRTKVSDVEGDPNVAGVYASASPTDDGPLDFWLAMTGDMIIRIAEGVTVQRGQLLMSAGDGTAKPQGDGFVQDKTIAKVTSTNVTCTYDDGSYCVPCVLMAC